MHRRVISFLTSLLFHTSPPSFQDTKSLGSLKTAEKQRPKNADLAIGLARAFKGGEFEMGGSDMSYSLDTNTVPFVFPISKSYDMDLSRTLSKGTGIEAQYIFSVLVQIIYRLLQFHIQRLFRLEPPVPLIPNPSDEQGEIWEDNPNDWFFILLGAIMPGAIIDVHDHNEPIVVNRIFIKPFQFLRKESDLFEYSTLKDGSMRTFLQRSGEEAPMVSVHLLPTHFLGSKLAPDQAIVHTISLIRSYPPCREILAHLLKGITFAFDLNHAELQVIIKPTKDIPSVEKSRHLLKGLFKVPIATQMMIPESIESVLQRRIIPKASCYHPTNTLLGSPDLYERMLTLIVALGILMVLQLKLDGNISVVMVFLEEWLQQFLPGSSIKVSKDVKSTFVREVCTYDPESSSMHIHTGDINGKRTSISLNVGKPVMFNHIQMGALRQAVFPIAFKISIVEKADTPFKHILNAIVIKLAKSIRVEKRSMPVTPGTKEQDEIIALEQLGAFAFRLGAFLGTVENTIQIFSKSSLGKSTASLGKYRTALMTLNAAGDPHHIAFPTLYPMPLGKLFATNLRTGRTLRNKVPLMLIGTKMQGEVVSCRILWFQSKSCTQPLTKIADIFEYFPSGELGSE